MWTFLSAIYVIGLVTTTLSIRRERCVGAGPVVEATWSLLWPLYWSVIVLCTLRDRRARK